MSLINFQDILSILKNFINGGFKKHVHLQGFNTPRKQLAVFSPKGVMPELVKTLLVGYLDVKGSPPDDG